MNASPSGATASPTLPSVGTVVTRSIAHEPAGIGPVPEARLGADPRDRDVVGARGVDGERGVEPGPGPRDDVRLPGAGGVGRVADLRRGEGLEVGDVELAIGVDGEAGLGVDPVVDLVAVHGPPSDEEATAIPLGWPALTRPNARCRSVPWRTRSSDPAGSGETSTGGAPGIAGSRRVEHAVGPCPCDVDVAGGRDPDSRAGHPGVGVERLDLGHHPGAGLVRGVVASLTSSGEAVRVSHERDIERR